MKFDFDTYEFAGLIAPGSVVVLAVAILFPQLIHGADPAILIASGVVGAYILGHLVAAFGNLVAQRIFDKIGICRLKGLDPTEWEKRKRRFIWKPRSYISSHQRANLPRQVKAVLGDNADFDDLVKHRLLTKQMYLALHDKHHLQTLETFAGLYSLSRGLAVSFIVALILCLMAGQYVGGLFCAGAAGLSVYRSNKFNDSYSLELVQQFLLLKPRAATPSQPDPAREGSN